MNRKSLLFVVVASLMTLSAGAQLKGVDGVAPSQPLSLSRVQPQFEVMDMQLREPGEVVTSPHQSPEFLKPYYLRPAGAFYSAFLAVNGVGWYSFGNYEFIQVKPYKDYTYYSVVNGADENDEMIWDNTSGGVFSTCYSQNLTVKYGLEMTETPVFYLYHSDLNVDECFQYPHFVPVGNGVVNNLNPAYIYSAVDASYLGDEDEYEFLLSSKTMCQRGRDGNLSTMFVTYNDAIPFGNNMYGRWFGKNGGHYDGMAQAFEKPTHPYLLKEVCVQTAGLECLAPVELCCKVYRLDEIPAYRDDEPVELSGDFGDPIATGYTTVTPDTYEETYGSLTFTLYSHEEDDPELVYEINPTVDYPILVVFEDYNNPECDALRDFTCFVSADMHVDEGYGELAYLKCPVNDDEGNFTGEYVWKGLNNLFSTGEMKTGYTIFIVADQPYLAFSNNDDGEYVFPRNGGLMDKYPVHPQVYSDGMYPSIMFLSSNASEDWEITWNGSSVLPDWLGFEVEDMLDESGDFTDAVGVNVTAAPLPDGVGYREAVIRFEIPGDYQDYKFMQGKANSVTELLNSSDAVAVDYYDIMGHKLPSLQQGLNIVRMSDGTARKIFLK